MRSIKLDNKPDEMLQVSPKGSVPVLVVEDSLVIEESLEIMLWALEQNDPDDLLWADSPSALPEMLTFIYEFERTFTPAMNTFACAKRYHEDNINVLRAHCEAELSKLEHRLSQHAFVFSEEETLVDIALLPFLRKYARIDKQWFRNSSYLNLKNWLNGYIQSPLFSKVMKHYELWTDNRIDQDFGPN
ncbi:glutathione S-transferase domain protein [Vibrio ishigakensis]|uniref:Glutathione S-transferase domain protein n=2 Tax=Vibrio ishigakensis TaxID=1481914 RepID=A0A0B8P113_9VIBR|nr:glutathione S-transferase domain protein [Vibrio ishigakensis]